MKKKIALFLLTAVFLLSQTSFVDAKSRSSSSGSRSFSSGYKGSSKSSGGSSSKSSGNSGSSKSSGASSSKSSGNSGSSKSSGDSSGSGGSSSSSKSSGDSSGSGSSSDSSSRSVPGSYSGSSSSSSNKASDKSSGSAGSGSSSSGSSGSKSSGSASSSVKSKTETKKNSYMQDYYKTQASKSNYTTYKQTLNDQQKKASDEASNRSYNYGSNRMNFEDAMKTRTQRVNNYTTSRPSRININIGMFNGPFSYGSAFVGPWDLWFLTRASDMFWFHHWTELILYREYFDAIQFAERERLIRQMEAQNIARDASYVDPDIDYDLQFSPEYAQNHVGNMYYTNKYSKPVRNPFKVLLTIIVLIVLLIIIIKVVSRPRRVKKYNSGGGIY